MERTVDRDEGHRTHPVARTTRATRMGHPTIILTGDGSPLRTAEPKKLRFGFRYEIGTPAPQLRATDVLCIIRASKAIA